MASEEVDHQQAKMLAVLWLEDDAFYEMKQFAAPLYTHSGITLELATDFEAGHARHHYVEQYQVGLLAGHLGEGLDAVGGYDSGDVRYVLHVGAQQFEVLYVVVDYQHLGWR